MMGTCFNITSHLGTFDVVDLLKITVVLEQLANFVVYFLLIGTFHHQNEVYVCIG